MICMYSCSVILPFCAHLTAVTETKGGLNVRSGPNIQSRLVTGMQASAR